MAAAFAAVRPLGLPQRWGRRPGIDVTAPVMPLISAGDLARRMGEPNLVVIDCRHEITDPEAGERRFVDGHIPGARHAHLDRDLARAPRAADGRHPLPDIAALVGVLNRLGVSNDSMVVVYDDCGGAMAARLWWMLRWLGHVPVAVLDGGIGAWLSRGETLETGRGNRGIDPGSFEPATVHDDWVVDAGQLAELLAKAEIVLLDARAPQRFAGLTEPIDPVAGHIPGAVNLPFNALLRPDGAFLDAESLTVKLEGALGGRPAGAAVAMCGSGVTACHLLLGMAAAGLAMGRLYAGSWSEWIRDSQRPVATGLFC